MFSVRAVHMTRNQKPATVWRHLQQNWDGIQMALIHQEHLYGCSERKIITCMFWTSLKPRQQIIENWEMFLSVLKHSEDSPVSVVCQQVPKVTKACSSFGWILNMVKRIGRQVLSQNSLKVVLNQYQIIYQISSQNFLSSSLDRKNVTNFLQVNKQ